MKIVVVVNTYFPDKKLLKESIDSYYQYVDHILVWENTPPDKSFDYRLEDIGEKVEYVGCGRNTGFPESFNFTISYALRNGYDYMMTMNQDSVWIDFNCFKVEAEKINSRVACLMGPATIKPGATRYRNRGSKETRWLITSGMLVPVALANDIKGFNDNFFMDCNDIEFCLRAKSHGYKSYMNYDGVLEHKVGDYSEKKFGKKRINVVYYSSFRIQEMIKNHILLYRNYHHPELKREIKNLIKMHISAIMFVKGKRIERLKALINGTYYGITWKLNYKI